MEIPYIDEEGQLLMTRPHHVGHLPKKITVPDGSSVKQSYFTEAEPLPDRKKMKENFVSAVVYRTFILKKDEPGNYYYQEVKSPQKEDKSMEVKELITKREDLKKAIAQAINNFVQETGVDIERLQVNFIDNTPFSGPPSMIMGKIDIRLAI